MARVRYKPDRKGVAAMLRSAEFAQLVTDAAEHGADAARAAAPKGETGDLVGSIHVEYVGDKGGPKGDRVEARIVADAEHAAAVQFGTRHRGAEPYLNAAIDAIEGPGG